MQHRSEFCIAATSSFATSTLSDLSFLLTSFGNHRRRYACSALSKLAATVKSSESPFLRNIEAKETHLRSHEAQPALDTEDTHPVLSSASSPSNELRIASISE